MTDDQMFDAMARAALEAMSRSWMTDEAVLRSARRDRDSALEGRDNALRRCAELEERLRLHTEIREHDAKVEAATRDTLKVDVTFNVVPDTSGVRAEVLGMLPQIEEAVRRAVRTPPA